MVVHRNDGFRSMPTDTETSIPRDKGRCTRRIMLGWTHLVMIIAGSILLGVGFTMQGGHACHDEHINKSTATTTPKHNIYNIYNMTTSTKLNIETPIPETLVDDGKWPKVAWLMSFPNSGTSFTSQMVRHLSHQSTASNYGEELLDDSGKSIPIFPSTKTGPFWIDPQSDELQDFTRPTLFALTKTHCGGRCEKCGPSKYVENTHSFLTQCLTGKTAHTTPNGKVVKERVAPYDKDLVQRAIHLIRSPFDNVVSRFHLELHGYQHANDTQKLAMYPPTQNGFRKFCMKLNTVYEKEEQSSRLIDSTVFELMKDIPCRGDFFRFVQWHNLAIVTTQSLRIPTLVVHYEKYETNYNETAMEMMKFLHLEPRGELIEFYKGKEYVEYFTVAERANVKEAMRRMALSSTWEQISHYFD